MELEIGDIVEPISNDFVLHCGSGIYDCAIVLSINPFIMASLSSDMRWSCEKIENYTKIRKGTKDELNKCLRRLER